MLKEMPSIKKTFLSAIFILFLGSLASCNDDMPAVRDPCDFIISTEESSLDTSTSTCQECFFKFSFRGKVYDFRDDRIEKWFGCEEGKCTITAKNNFFEFRLKSLQRSSDLFSSLN
ncbi:MAG: hypothetical protein KF763_03095 [Cyclobacteriaceae bacterium]|nr:hypothetical protein [Cyclobacteriaceae bacterium]